MDNKIRKSYVGNKCEECFKVITDENDMEWNEDDLVCKKCNEERG